MLLLGIVVWGHRLQASTKYFHHYRTFDDLSDIYYIAIQYYSTINIIAIYQYPFHLLSVIIILLKFNLIFIKFIKNCYININVID